MKKMLRRILSFVMLVCVAFMGVFTMPMVSAKAAASYTETAFGEGELLITTTYKGDTYYLPAETTGSSNPPKAVKFTDVSGISDENLWTVTAADATAGTYYIQNKDGAYLYNTNTNNGVRIASTKMAWTYDEANNGFKGASDRYLGIYNAQDWRCYTSVTAGNFDNGDDTYNSKLFKFYKVNADAPTVTISGDSYMQANGTVTLTAEAKNTTSTTVAWSSSNTDVATVVNKDDVTGTVTGLSVGTATITASVGTEAEATKEIKVYPSNTNPISIAEALTVCELTDQTNAPYAYSTTGFISSIDTEYSEEHGNITVTITDGTDSIKAYRMAGGSELQVGDEIKVTGTLVNYNGTTPEFIAGCTYVKEVDDNWEAIKAKLDLVDAYMKLGYKYTQTTDERPVSATTEVTDTLDREFTEVEAKSSYADWSNKTGESGAIYAGNSAGDKNSIQLRTTNNNAGVITTTSGGKAKKVTIAWHTDTTSTRKLEVFGKNTPYEASTDLYDNDNNKKGTSLGTLAFANNETELTIEGDYEYIGFKSTSGALYLTSVEITWEKESGATTGETETVVELNNSEFRILCGVNAGLLDIEGVTGYGIQVTAEGQDPVYYASTSEYWVREGDMVYVVINLGDIVNNKAKLNTVFTVKAYVEYDGGKRTSNVEGKEATYSVVSMLYAYMTDGVESVAPLVEYLRDNGLV